MLSDLSPPKSFIFRQPLIVILFSLFSFATEAMPCKRGFVLERPGSVLNRFKSLVNTRSFNSVTVREKIRRLVPQLSPGEIQALKKRDIKMLEIKALFVLFTPKQLIVFTEEQRGWSRELSRRYVEAAEMVATENADPVLQIIRREIDAPY